MSIQEENIELKTKLEKFKDYEDLKNKIKSLKGTLELHNSVVMDKEDKILAIKQEIMDKNNEINKLNKIILENNDKVVDSDVKTSKKDLIKINNFYMRVSNILAITEIMYGINSANFNILLKDKIKESLELRISIVIGEKNIKTMPQVTNEIESLHKKIIELI